MRLMLVVQVALDPLSFFEAKSMRQDRRTLEGSSEGVLTYHVTDQRVHTELGDFRIDQLQRELHRQSADLVHVYGSQQPPPRWIGTLGRPYLAPWSVSGSRLPWRRIPAPAAILSPLDPGSVPEAVDEEYVANEDHPPGAAGPYLIGSAGPDRKGIGLMTRATMARLGRFRDDVEWRIFDTVPSAAEMRDLDLWIDPALDGLDFDGGTAEALCSRKAVVASRTEINRIRTAEGTAAFLVPPGDPNEMTHAILMALFKPELRKPRSQRLITIGERFNGALRSEKLLNLYRSILR